MADLEDAVSMTPEDEDAFLQLLRAAGAQPGGDRAALAMQTDDADARTVAGDWRSKRVPPGAPAPPDRENFRPIEQWPHQRPSAIDSAADVLNPINVARRGVEWARGAGNFAANSFVGGLSGGRTTAGQVLREAGDMLPAGYKPFGSPGLMQRVGDATDADADRWARQNQSWLEPAGAVGEFLLGGLGPGGQLMRPITQGIRSGVDRARAAEDRAANRRFEPERNRMRAEAEASRVAATDARARAESEDVARAHARQEMQRVEEMMMRDRLQQQAAAESRARQESDRRKAEYVRKKWDEPEAARRAERTRMRDVTETIGDAVRAGDQAVRRRDRDDRISRPALPYYTAEQNNVLMLDQARRRDAEAARRGRMTGRERGAEDLEGEAFVARNFRNDPERAARAAESADQARRFREGDPGTTATSEEIMRAMAIERAMAERLRRHGYGDNVARSIDEAAGYDPAGYGAVIDSLERANWRFPDVMPAYALQDRGRGGRLEPMTPLARNVLDEFRRREAGRGDGDAVIGFGGSRP